MSMYYVIIGPSSGHNDWDRRRLALAYTFTTTSDDRAMAYCLGLLTERKPSIIAAYRFIDGIPAKMNIAPHIRSETMSDVTREAIRLERVSPSSWPQIEREPLSADLPIVRLGVQEEQIGNMCSFRQLAMVANKILEDGITREELTRILEVNLRTRLTVGEMLLIVMLYRHRNNRLGPSFSAPHAVSQHFQEVLSKLLENSLEKRGVDPRAVMKQITQNEKRRNS